MADNCFSCLHLTDLHYGLDGQDCLWPNLRQPFLDDLTKLHDRCGPWHAVLFTGDLVQSGGPDQFQAMQQEFLEPLWKRLRELGSGEAKLFAVPGNHDLIRPDSKQDNPAADMLLEADGFAHVEDTFWSNAGCSYRSVIEEAFAAYVDWWGKATQRPDGVIRGTLPGDFTVTLPVAGRCIGIVGLNTETEIAPAGRFAAHLFGHMHETDIQHIRRGGSEKATRQLQGCSVFGMEKHGDPPTIERAHGYSAGRIDFDGGGAALRLWPRIATCKTGPWRYILDGQNAELEADEGTAPDRLHCRMVSARPSVHLRSRCPLRRAPQPR